MLPASYATAAAAVLAVGGLLACFAGYRLFRLVLGIYGFIIGASITTTIVGASGTWTLVLAGIVGGLLGAVLMVAAYFVGVGLIGAGLAALALNLIWRLVEGPGAQPATLVLVIVAVIGALGALSLVRYVVVFGTALAGAWTLIVGALALAGSPGAMRATSAGDIWVLYPLDPSPGRWWYIAVWFGLSLAGAVVQLATTKKTGGRKTRAARRGLPSR
jgi:hypothetical protein